MTIKERAKFMFNEYLTFTDTEYNAKKCAMVALKQIINALDHEGLHYKAQYWIEILKEIAKLK